MTTSFKFLFFLLLTILQVNCFIKRKSNCFSIRTHNYYLLNPNPKIDVKGFIEVKVELEVSNSVQLMLSKIDAKFETLDARFDKIDARFDKIDGRLNTIETELKGGKIALTILIALSGILFSSNFVTFIFEKSEIFLTPSNVNMS